MNFKEDRTPLYDVLMPEDPFSTSDRQLLSIFFLLIFTDWQRSLTSKSQLPWITPPRFLVVSSQCRCSPCANPTSLSLISNTRCNQTHQVNYRQVSETPNQNIPVTSATQITCSIFVLIKKKWNVGWGCFVSNE